MVGGMPGAFDLTKRTAHGGRGFAHDREELLGRHARRTRTCDKHAAGGQHAESGPCEPSVGGDRARDFFALLRECGRIKDHHVEPTALSSERGEQRERIPRQQFMGATSDGRIRFV